MIALIAQTLAAATRYVADVQSAAHQTGKAHVAAHSTLIVVPSARKLILVLRQHEIYYRADFEKF